MKTLVTLVFGCLFSLSFAQQAESKPRIDIQPKENNREKETVKMDDKGRLEHRERREKRLNDMQRELKHFERHRRPNLDGNPKSNERLEKRQREHHKDKNREMKREDKRERNQEIRKERIERGRN